MNIIITKSPNPKKKYRVYISIPNEDGFQRAEPFHIDFGAVGYSDYTINKSDVKKNAYIARHRVREDFTNPYTAGFWSRWILWNKKTLIESIRDLEKRMNINIRIV
jgi:hypothetical protein